MGSAHLTRMDSRLHRPPDGTTPQFAVFYPKLQIKADGACQSNLRFTEDMRDGENILRLPWGPDGQNRNEETLQGRRTGFLHRKSFPAISSGCEGAGRVEGRGQDCTWLPPPGAL